MTSGQERAVALADDISRNERMFSRDGYRIPEAELDLIVRSLRSYAKSPPESVYQAVERILDEKSAWVARPDNDVTMAIAMAATIAAMDAVEMMQTGMVSSPIDDSYDFLKPSEDAPHPEDIAWDNLGALIERIAPDLHSCARADLVDAIFNEWLPTAARFAETAP